MRARRMSSETSVTALTKILYAVIVALVAGSLWFGVSLYTAKMAANEAQAIADINRAKIKELQDLMRRADGLQSSVRASGLAAINHYQSAFEKAAESRGCLLTEYISSRSVNPYLSRYSKDAPDGGWQQVEVKAQLVGTARSVIETIASLKNLEIPFEIQSLEFTRQETEKLTEAKVSARVELTILIQASETNS